MARWKLTAAHYLNVPGTEWEYKETDQSTGKQARKVYPVPALLNPDDSADCNYPGEIIVAYAGSPHRKDIIFLGEPTPDMEPLDEEAEAISAALRPKWTHPIDTLPGNGDYSASLLTKFEREIDNVMSRTQNKNTSVSADDFTKLQEQVAALMAENEKLKAKVPARRP